MSDEPEILARVEAGVGRITLNRPKALHALNRGMCEAMIAALLDWRADEAVKSVLIDHAGERGFCAGGDIRMIAESGAGDAAEARRFFDTEYKLYKNLSLFVELGYIRLDLDKDLWKGVGYEAKENNFKGTFSIGYKF